MAATAPTATAATVYMRNFSARWRKSNTGSERPPRERLNLCDAQQMMPVLSKMSEHLKTGRPPKLSRVEEFELYCYRKSGISIKTCASMWRVSVPTANRIIAKFRSYESRVEPIAREFRDMIETIETQL